MNRFGLFAGMMVVGISFCFSNTAQAEHDHENVFRKPRPPRFGAYSHVDELALDVMKRSNSLCWEMYRHYRNERGYRQTYRDAYEMLKTAEYIHELIHHRGRRSRVASEVEELDSLFHQIKRDVKHWRSYGHGDFHDTYYARGGLNERLRMLEVDLHHLMDDVGYKSKRTRAPQPSPVGYQSQGPKRDSRERSNRQGSPESQSAGPNADPRVDRSNNRQQQNPQPRPVRQQGPQESQGSPNINNSNIAPLIPAEG